VSDEWNDVSLFMMSMPVSNLGCPVRQLYYKNKAPRATEPVRLPAATVFRPTVAAILRSARCTAELKVG
jgi:hypothetical protein